MKKKTFDWKKFLIAVLSVLLIAGLIGGMVWGLKYSKDLKNKLDGVDTTKVIASDGTVITVLSDANPNFRFDKDNIYIKINSIDLMKFKNKDIVTTIPDFTKFNLKVRNGISDLDIGNNGNIVSNIKDYSHVSGSSSDIIRPVGKADFNINNQEDLAYIQAVVMVLHSNIDNFLIHSKKSSTDNKISSSYVYKLNESSLYNINFEKNELIISFNDLKKLGKDVVTFEFFDCSNEPSTFQFRFK